MTLLAREDETRNYPEAIQALGIGVLQTITEVAAAKDVIFFDIGVAPDASTGNRVPMTPDTGVFWKCVPGDKVAAHDGTAGGTIANAVGANTTIVYLYYDKTAGTAYVLECT